MYTAEYQLYYTIYCGFGAPTGQTEAQAPQLIHSSLITYAIVIILLKMFVDMIIRYYVQKFNTETQFNRVLLKIKSIKNV